MKVASNLDFQKNQIQNAVCQLLASDPGTPTEGQFYYDSTNKLWKYHNGTSFVSDTARSRHTGTQTASTISDFDTQVRTSRLDQMAAPTASVSWNSQKITNLAAGTAGSTDAARMIDIDNARAGLSVKDPVRVAAQANVNLASPGTTVDGVTMSNGQRFLAPAQTTASQNGIYVFNGSGSTATRATDADAEGEVVDGSIVAVQEGTDAGKQYIQRATSTGAPGTWDQDWAVYSTGGTSYVGGAGLVLTGSTFDVGAGTGITVNANDVQLDTAHARNVDHTAVSLTAGAGLTGGGDISANRSFAVGAGTGITVNADDVAVDTAVVARKYTSLIGDGSTTNIAVNHALGNQWVTVQVIEVATLKQVLVDVTLTDANNATINFSAAPASNSHRVIVIG